MVRVRAIHEGCEEDEAGGSGHTQVNYDRESSVVMTGLFLGPRGSGAVNSVAASGDPSFAGPTLPLKRRTSCDERVSSRQSGVEAGSGGDGPVGETSVSYEPEPLVVVIVETSPRLAMSGVSAIVGR